MSSIYDIRVEDTEGSAITYGGGDIKVLGYLTNRAVKALAEVDSDSEVSVLVKVDGETSVSFKGDADSAALVLKGKVSKLRKAAGDTDSAE